MQRAGYVGPMSENPDDARTGSHTGQDAGANLGRDTGGDAVKGDAAKTARDKDDVRSESPEGDLSTKLDPDVIPQQGDTPEVERTREHPEETGS